MKRLSIFLLILLAFNACDVLEGPKKIINPYNPADDEFVPPSVTFSTGPAEGEIMNDCDVSLSWNGNAESMNFRYKLDDSDWSEWSNENSAMFDLLDEGLHSFSIESRYFNQVTSDEAQTINFIVDDIQGQSLVFFPRKSIVAYNETFSLDIIGHEIENVMGMNIVINYNRSDIFVESVDILDASDELLKSTNGNIIQFQDIDNENGTVEVDLGIVSNSTSGIEGTGSLIRLHCKKTSNNQTEIKFNTNTLLRDTNNQSIDLLEMVNGMVVAE